MSRTIEVLVGDVDPLGVYYVCCLALFVVVSIVVLIMGIPTKEERKKIEEIRRETQRKVDAGELVWAKCSGCGCQEAKKPGHGRFMCDVCEEEAVRQWSS